MTDRQYFALLMLGFAAIIALGFVVMALDGDPQGPTIRPNYPTPVLDSDR